MLTNHEDIQFVFQILELRAKVLKLNARCFESGIYKHRKEFQYLDRKLVLLLKSITKYDFVNRVNTGLSLLVGEGNLSFTFSLIKQLRIFQNLVTSTYESYKDLSDVGQNNAMLLKQAGVKVVHEVDATRIHEILPKQFFDTIIFQFPHSGSRVPIKELNPNYVLVHDFIISSSHILKKKGSILITIVDNAFYNNMFRFEDLSKKLAMQKPVKYKFDPRDYPEYTHTMTHQDESAIDEYGKFATWEFRL
jgi:hypothetical protein